MRTTEQEPRGPGPSPWWLLPAIGSPAAGAIAWWWFGVHHPALLLKNSGSPSAATDALITGVIVVAGVAAGVFVAVAAFMAGRPRRQAVAADLAAAQAEAQAAGLAVSWDGADSLHVKGGPGTPYYMPPLDRDEEVSG